uniref:RadC-like JAB domain-containing protein n=1 Tax=Candidatus Kentrum sp. LPFa TaxID=2126335 RepID=A0A450XWV6_9GAMM|nr:MAG: RadC-like JAB domain-containing protein [Candidatus Kentron sp. LPFa]VFK33779.1 MAG: RadC-like JAB domain-containing protein [Candidatus Kentron sp. LPFa]
MLDKSPHIMLVQNHTDGTLGPSKADKEVTRRLIEGGKLLNIRVSDHLIISEDGYYSFLEQGSIENAESREME